MSETSLIVAEKLNAVTLYTEGGMDVILTEIEAKIKAFTPDVSTGKGREEIKSFAYKIARSKTLLDDLGKNLVAVQKAETKKVDVVRKKARDFCDTQKAKVRTPLDEWEAEDAKRKAEEARKEKEKIQARVDTLAKYGKALPFSDVAGMTDEEHETTLEAAEEEFYEEQARIAEEIRLENERKAKEEADRKAEIDRLAQEREDLDKRRVEQEAAQAKIDEANRKTREAQESTQAKLDATKAAFEAEQKAAQEKKSREEFERKAKEKAEADAKAETERKQQEQAERERAEAEEKARQDALRPDKDKLLSFLQEVYDLSITYPLGFKDEKVQFVCDAFVDIIQGQIAKTKKEVEEL